MLMTFSAVFSAAREASRYGAAVGRNTLGVPFDHDCDGMRAAAVRVGSLGGVKTNNIAIKMLGPDGLVKKDALNIAVGDNWCTASNTSWPTVLGDIVEVTVAVNYAPVVPLVPIPKLTVSGGSGGIRSSASRTIVQDVEVPVPGAGSGGSGTIDYRLTVNYFPTTLNGGTVTPSTAVNNPDIGPYPTGTVVHLTPNPAAGWHFVGWSGPDPVDGSNNIVMDMDRTVHATFEQDPYPLVISQVGSGTVSPQVGVTMIAPGTQVTLTASAAPSWSFVGWSGSGLSGNASPLTITMDSPKNIRATFTNSQTYPLTSSVVGSGTVTPASGTYTYGDVALVTANPSDSCWSFTTWKINGANAGSTNPLPITITGNTAVTATFQENPFSLTTGTFPADGSGGTITPASGQYACSTAGQTVDVTAKPAPGWVLSGWSGVSSSNGLTAKVILSPDNANPNVIASFIQEQYPLTVAILPGSTGTSNPTNGVFTYGQNVTVTAIPARGYGFSSWLYPGVNNATVNGNTITINPITGPMPLTANFTPICAPTELIILTGPVLSATTGGTSGTATWQIDNRTALDVEISQITINSFSSSDWKDILAFSKVDLNGKTIWAGNISGNGKANDGYPQTLIPNSNSLVPISNGNKSQFVFSYTFNDKRPANTLSFIDISITFSNRCQ